MLYLEVEVGECSAEVAKASEFPLLKHDSVQQCSVCVTHDHLELTEPGR